MIRRAAFGACALILLAGGASAQTLPALSGRVVDQAGILSPNAEAAITERLQAVETAKGAQIVVATIADLEGYEIADYGVALGRAWGIGTQGRDDGALLIVAPNDRRVRIEVGYGLEGMLTDATSRTIIDGSILPRFRAGDLEGGVLAGVEAMIAALDGIAPAPPPTQRRSGGGTPNWLPFAMFGAFILMRMLLPNSGGGRRRRRGGFIGGVPIGGYGGRRGGFGGGGFGGGGGSFGGGGASGGW